MEKRQLIDLLTPNKLKALDKEIGSISTGKSAVYLSSSWSMHELFIYLLDQAGPVDVFISSYSISEESVRAFALAKDMGYIKKFVALFDYTTKKHKADFINFIANIADEVRTCGNHSKTLFLESDTVRIAVVSSQNLNRNQRVECGYVTAIEDQYDKLKASYKEFFEAATDLNK